MRRLRRSRASREGVAGVLYSLLRSSCPTAATARPRPTAIAPRYHFIRVALAEMWRPSPGGGGAACLQSTTVPRRHLPGERLLRRTEVRVREPVPLAPTEGAASSTSFPHVG